MTMKKKKQIIGKALPAGKPKHEHNVVLTGKFAKEEAKEPEHKAIRNKLLGEKKKNAK
jgi:hypothetical protein